MEAARRDVEVREARHGQRRPVRPRAASGDRAARLAALPARPPAGPHWHCVLRRALWAHGLSSRGASCRRCGGLSRGRVCGRCRNGRDRRCNGRRGFCDAVRYDPRNSGGGCDGPMQKSAKEAAAPSCCATATAGRCGGEASPVGAATAASAIKNSADGEWTLCASAGRSGRRHRPLLLEAGVAEHGDARSYLCMHDRGKVKRCR